jgi:hypothetical protein
MDALICLRLPSLPMELIVSEVVGGFILCIHQMGCRDVGVPVEQM